MTLAQTLGRFWPFTNQSREEQYESVSKKTTQIERPDDKQQNARLVLEPTTLSGGNGLRVSPMGVIYGYTLRPDRFEFPLFVKTVIDTHCPAVADEIHPQEPTFAIGSNHEHRNERSRRDIVDPQDLGRSIRHSVGLESEQYETPPTGDVTDLPDPVTIVVRIGIFFRDDIAFARRKEIPNESYKHLFCNPSDQLSLERGSTDPEETNRTNTIDDEWYEYYDQTHFQSAEIEIPRKAFDADNVLHLGGE